MDHGHQSSCDGTHRPQSSSSRSSAERVVGLLVRSLRSPDTLMMYVNVKRGICLPIGLLPGTTATFHGFKAKTSKLGNVYCSSSAVSSIQIHSLDDSDSGQEADVNGITLQMDRLDASYLYDLMVNLLHGRLTRRIACVRGKFSMVQQVWLQYVCLTCNGAVTDGRCRAVCSGTNPALKAEGRYVDYLI